MKKTRFLLLCAFLLATSFSLQAQVTVKASAVGEDCSPFYTFKEGMITEMTSYSDKGKVTSKTQSEMKSIRKEEGRVVATLASTITDDKNKEVSKGEYTVTCDDGDLFFDMSSIIPSNLTESFQSMDVKMDGDDLLLPSKLTAGQTLPDAVFTMKASTNGMALMTMTVTIADRKVEAKESITTPAGTFECYKVTQNTKVKMMISRTMKSVMWYAPKIGCIRIEDYNEKGKMISYTEMTKRL